MKKIWILFAFFLLGSEVCGQQAVYEKAMRDGRTEMSKREPDFRKAVELFRAAEAAADRSRNERNIDLADKALQAAKDAWIAKLAEDNIAFKKANEALDKAQDSLITVNTTLEKTLADLKSTNKALEAEKLEVERQRDKADARRLALQADNLLADEEYETALDLTYFAYQLDSRLTDVNLSFGNAVYQKTARIVNDTLRPISQAVFSPDSSRNQLLIAGSRSDNYGKSAFQLQMLQLDDPLKDLNIDEGQLIPFDNNTGVLSLGFSPDGRQFYAGVKDGRLLLWDQNGKAAGDFPTQNSAFLSACFLAGNQRILAGLRNGVAQVWEANGQKPLKELKGRHSGPVYSVDYARATQRFLTRSSDRIVQLWDAETFQPLNDRIGHPLYAYKAVFSPDGRQFLTVAADREATVRLWNSLDGQLLKTIKSPDQSAAIDAGYSKDGRRIYVLRDDNTLQILDAQREETKTVSGIFPADLTTAAFSPDSRYLLVGMESGLVLLLDAESGEPAMRLDKLESPVRQLAFSPDGSILLTLSQRGLLALAKAPDWMLRKMKDSEPVWTEEEKEKYDLRSESEVRR